MEATGDRIKALRVGRGMSQQDLLNRVRAALPERKVALENLSRIENGHQEPGAWALRGLARALNTTADYLLGLVDDPAPRGAQEPGVPLGTPDLAPLLARLKRLTLAQRQEAAAAFERILDMLEPDPSALEAQLKAYFARLSPSDREEAKGMLADVLRTAIEEEADRSKKAAMRVSANS